MTAAPGDKAILSGGLNFRYARAGGTSSGGILASKVPLGLWQPEIRAI